MLNPTPERSAAMKDKSFYQQLGRRIAERRKALGLTQTDLAQTLGVAQQTMAHYEGGTARIAVAMLPIVAKALSISLEELIEGHTASRSKRGPASKLQQQFEQVSRLPRAKQQFLSNMIATVIKAEGVAA
jgi:transcriptional regulator with XRE-family HTH domain